MIRLGAACLHLLITNAYVPIEKKKGLREIQKLLDSERRQKQLKEKRLKQQISIGVSILHQNPNLRIAADEDLMFQNDKNNKIENDDDEETVEHLLNSTTDKFVAEESPEILTFEEAKKRNDSNFLVLNDDQVKFV